MLDWLFGKKKEEPQQQKPKKSKKEAETEDKWMYDFMVQFLSSPIWRVSILDFVDNKCIVFDNEEENKFEYTIIHNQFKELVGNLVDGMMEEIGMGEEKLAQTIQKGLESKEKKLFNQLLLADDFLRFKDLMLKRNRSLQQEAIKALQENQFKPAHQQQKVNQRNAQAELVRESRRIEEQRKLRIEEQEDQMLRRAIQMSKISNNESQAIRQLQEKATDKVKEEEKPKKQQKSQEEAPKVTQAKQKTSRLQPLKGAQSVKPQLSDLPPLKSTLNRNRNQNDFQEKVILSQKVEQPREYVKEQVNQQVKEQIKQRQAPQSVQVSNEQKVESMQDRKQRLVAQRQKIRKQKQEQRRKQLEQQEEEREKESRVVVHSVVLQEEGFFQNQQVKKDVGQVKSVPEEELRRRRELMNKIKNRIIDDL